MVVKTLIEVLTGLKNHTEEGVTFIEGGNKEEFLSYAELYHTSLKALSFLQAKGIRPKGELVFQIEDEKSFVIVFWACILGGIIPVPLSIGLKDDHKQKVFNVWRVLKNPYLISGNASRGKLKAYSKENRLQEIYSDIEVRSIDLDDIGNSRDYGVINNASEGDIAFIQFSSGSTGNPKGVTLTHKNILTNIKGISKAASYSDKDSLLSWMPLTHDMGLIGFHLNPVYGGLNHYLIPTDLFIRRPSLWLDKASEHRISVLCSPNFGYRYVLKHCNKPDKHPWDLSNVRLLYNGAEPISASLCSEFTGFMSEYGLRPEAICPVYGLAEASLAVSISGIEDKVSTIYLDRNKMNIGDGISINPRGEDPVSIVNVGKPVENCSIQIVDRTGRDLDNRVIGLIRIKGDNVTGGYYNNATATHSAMGEDGWLNTGDIGFMNDNSLYITGRDKDLLFMNGQNFYPHDIERMAESAEGIELNRIAVAGFFNPATQKDHAIAFIMHRGSLENFIPVSRAVRDMVSVKAGFELDKIIPVKDIPKTTSGKLQRFRLLEQYREGKFDSIEAELKKIVAPAGTEGANRNGAVTDIEKRLLDIWRKVLSDPEIDISSRFFEAGGNSLKAAEVGMLLLKEFQVDLPFDVLYENQTVQELSNAITGEHVRLYTPIPVISGERYHPVSSSQRRLYYAWESDKDSLTYNTPFAFLIRGDIVPDKLTKAIHTLILRHDSLRMSFFRKKDAGFEVWEDAEFSLHYETCNAAELDNTLRQLIQPFDLASPPLMRVSLVKIDGGGSVLFADFHHIITDGLSIGLFIEELILLYDGKDLPGLPTGYKDYAHWQNKMLDSEGSSIHEGYWLNQLDREMPVLEMPYDFQRPVMTDTKGQKLSFQFSARDTTAIRELAIDCGCTISLLILAMYKILLSKYTGQKDIVVGIPVNGRTHPDLQGLQGMFVNNLAIRCSIESGDNFRQFLGKEKNCILSAFEHQEYPYDSLVQKIGGVRDAGRSPLFDTMFIFQGMKFREFCGADLALSRYFFDPGCSKYDISLEVLDDGEKTIEYYFEYASKLFKRETIAILAAHFKNLVYRITKNPHILISDISVIDEREYDLYIRQFNHMGMADPATGSILQLFWEQVSNSPDRIAVVCGKDEITYGELDDRACCIANLVIQQGLSRNGIVCILLNRSAALISSILGVMKAGGAFLMIDPDLPVERIRYLIKNSCSAIVLSTSGFRSVIDVISADQDLSFIDVDEQGFAVMIAGVRKTAITPDDIAYLIYTSGTTGNPKGVLIAHRSLTNYICWASKKYVKGERCDFPLFTSVSFDLTITSIFTPLITGNRVIVYGEEKRKLLIEQIIFDNKVDIIKLTPSHLRMIRDMQWPEIAGGRRIKRFIVGGEPLDARLARDISDKFGAQVELYNEYGPTEATVGCMIHQFDAKEPYSSVPIGVPADTTQIYILDSFLKPVPGGVKGELYISGAGIAKGYLFDEMLTAEKFIENPFIPGQKMYRTGDVARRLSTGVIEYIGRFDKQVKINGHRIELSEIEVQLSGHEDIGKAVVAVRENEQHQKAVYAFYQVRVSPGRSDEELVLRNYLAERLPYYMIPSQFIRVDDMPLTKNGKIDYPALLRTAAGKTKSEDPLPGNNIEQLSMKIWKEVLGKKELTVTDNFLELGGDSIKAVQIASRLYEENVIVQVKEILTYQTIRQIGLYVKVANNGNRLYDQGIVTGEKRLTPAESWFFTRNFKNNQVYNHCVLLRFNRKMNKDLLETAFGRLISHHDALRLNYNTEKGVLFYNNDHLKRRFAMEEMNGIHSDLSSSSAFDITRDLLLKVHYLLQGNKEALLIIVHHLIIDGVSWRILMEDLYTIYHALESEQSTLLPHKTASLTDWQHALTEYSGSGRPDSEVAYWDAVRNISFSVPVDFQTVDWTIANRGEISGSLEKHKTELLMQRAYKVYKCDAQILLHAALVLTLKDWTGLDDYIVEIENHGRHIASVDTSRTVGWFTTMYPLHLRFCDGGITHLIKATKERVKSVPNNGIGYGILKFMRNHADVQAEHDPVEFRFNYLGRFDGEFDNELFSVDAIHADLGSAPQNNMTARVECNTMIVSGELRFKLYYNTKAHTQATMDRLRRSLIFHLEAIASHVENEHEIHFTPSDFDGVNIGQEELDSLFD